MRYKILWIDDEYKKQLDFIGEAEQEDFDIDAFESHEEGIAALNSRLDVYHAVILDAKVKKGKDDTVTGLPGLIASRDRIKEINKDGYLPFFIFTGQPDYTTSNIFTETYGKYYVKAIDNEQLFKDLKEAIEKKVEYQIQKRHKSVFDICTEKYIGSAARKDLFSILKKEDSDDFTDPDLHLNPLRKIMEDLFTAFNKWGFLPDVFIKNGIALNESSRFLKSEESRGYRLVQPVLPKIIQDNLKSILLICQNGSHRLEVDAFIKKIKTPYLLLSITYQLMDVLLWFKDLVDEKPDIEKNRLLWEAVPSIVSSGEWIKGKIIKIAENGYGTFQSLDGFKVLSIIPHKIRELKLSTSQNIEITTKQDSTGTKELIDQIKVV